jgi:hypothetical protein
MNCWEFKKCGREGGGVKSIELGTCPAYPDYGQQCARVAGTLCGGEVQGTFALKLGNCQKCEFYTSGHYDKTYSNGQKDPLKKANNVSQQSGYQKIASSGQFSVKI